MYPAKLEMLERNDVVIVEENESALFECKINIDLNPTCTWHRNGIQILKDHRTTIENDGEWQRLYLDCVKVSDHGLYTLECRHADSYISVPHRLYVSPQRNIYRVFHHSQHYLKNGVEKHLRNTRVHIGQTLVMAATFVYDTKNYFWFKNNAELHNDSRTKINKHPTRPSLTITDVKISDTGVYCVMARTDYGLFSSFADVIVGSPNEKRPLLPFIEDDPPEVVEGFIGEEIRITAKVQIDACSKIRWARNNAIIVTDKIQPIDYGNNYIGVTIPSPNITSAGLYQLLLINSATRHVVQVPLRVKVTEPPPSLPTEVNVVRKLESAVACCGAPVSFDCKFDLKDLAYLYVVWYVGPFKVERTNSTYSVISNRGQFVLYIKRFHPNMAGPVMCEIRRAHTSRASVKVCCSYAHLTCVPPCVIFDSPSSVSKLVLSQNIPRGTEFEANLYPDLQNTDEAAAANGGNYYVEIDICKVNGQGLYFLNITQSRDSRSTRVEIHEKVNDTDSKISTFISWRDTKPNPAFCYRIDMEQQDGTFARTGDTRQPGFWINDIPINRLLVFQIKEDMPQRLVEHLKIDILPLPEAVDKAPASRKLQTEEDFLATYNKTDFIIGAGAFGHVSLVEHKVSEVKYAAKIVKARSETDRENVFREFFILRSLSHPRIVNLFVFYETNRSYIFVMELCWGGELFDRMVAEDYIKEVDVVIYVRQICEALEYLGKVGVVHLDLKPENIVCISPNSTNVKIIDFGLAYTLAEGIPRTLLGTLDYMAPEVIAEEEISTFTDMWSLGVVTYVLLSGLLPFFSSNRGKTMINIGTVSYHYNDAAFGEVSQLALDFVDHLLVRIPNDRMTATEALAHGWLKEGPPEAAGSKCMTKMLKNMKTFLANDKQNWQRARKGVNAARSLRLPALHKHNY